MRRSTGLFLVIIAVIAALIILMGIELTAAEAATPGACPSWQAERDVREARQALRKAERRLAEAKRVLAATRTYSAQYCPAVGRWVRLARGVGWRYPEMPTLFMVVNRESGGDPYAVSACGTYVGLLQFSPAWGFDRLDPRKSLRRCLQSVRESGWVHWPTAY